MTEPIIIYPIIIMTITGKRDEVLTARIDFYTDMFKAMEYINKTNESKDDKYWKYAEEISTKTVYEIGKGFMTDKGEYE